MDWTAPQKPAEFAESRLIDAILTGRFPIDSALPAERELVSLLGVTRPTLREALQRLARDGWIEIRHGRPTRVRNYWQEGSLGVLGAIARQTDNLPPEFVPNLLVVRRVLAPAYIRLAVAQATEEAVKILQDYTALTEEPADFARFDWNLHHRMTVLSGNPIFTLILNGFRDLYQPMACIYFKSPHSRVNSRSFYSDLLAAATAGDAQEAEAITQRVMGDSLSLWQAAIYQS